MSKSLNPLAPEYTPIPPGICPNPPHPFPLFTLLPPAYSAAGNHLPPLPPPPQTYFPTQFFTYVAAPPPPTLQQPFYPNQTPTTFSYISTQQRNPNVECHPTPTPPPSSAAGYDSGRRVRCNSGVRGGFRGGRERGSRGGFVNERRRRRMDPVICDDNQQRDYHRWNYNSVQGFGREEKRVVVHHHTVMPLKLDEEKTTVMIKNIPYHCPRDELISLLDAFCMMESVKDRNEASSSKTTFEEHAYDFLYLPIDFRTKKSRGFAFVNFTNAKTVWRFFNAFHLASWGFVEWNKWPKKIEVVCAKIQGKEELVSHFSGSIFECDTDEYLPVGFDPARDGSGQPVNLTVVGQRGAIPLRHSSSRR